MAHFCVSGWLSISIAFTLMDAIEKLNERLTRAEQAKQPSPAQSATATSEGVEPLPVEKLTELHQETTKKWDESFKASKQKTALLTQKDEEREKLRREAEKIEEQDSQIKKFQRSGQPSLVTQRFSAFVKENAIEEMTLYARQDSHEFFAEAYHLFLNDPGFLQKVSQKLYTWFDEKRYMA